MKKVTETSSKGKAARDRTATPTSSPKLTDDISILWACYNSAGCPKPDFKKAAAELGLKPRTVRERFNKIKKSFLDDEAAEFKAKNEDDSKVAPEDDSEDED